MQDYLLMNQKTIKKIAFQINKALNINIDYLYAKKILYGNSDVTNEEEKKIKRTYDTLMYIVTNKETTITNETIKIIYYMLFVKEIDKNLENKIIDNIYQITNEDIIDKIIKLIKCLIKNKEKFENKEEIIRFYFVFSLYLIFKDKGKIIHINRYDIKEIVENIKEERIKELEEKYLKILLNQEYENKEEYYKNLKPLTANEIYEKLNEEKDFIIKNYHIENIILYGSFSNNTDNINSDIDLLVKFKNGLPYLKKVEETNRFKEYILVTFKRYGDIQEIINHMNIEMIKEIKNAIKIY